MVGATQRYDVSAGKHALVTCNEPVKSDDEYIIADTYPVVGFDWCRFDFHHMFLAGVVEGLCPVVTIGRRVGLMPKPERFISPIA